MHETIVTLIQTLIFNRRLSRLISLCRKEDVQGNILNYLCGINELIHVA